MYEIKDNPLTFYSAANDKGSEQREGAYPGQSPSDL